MTRAVQRKRDHVLAAERIGGGNRHGICFATSPFDAAGDFCGNRDRRGTEPARDSASGNGLVLGHLAAWNAAWSHRGICDAAVRACEGIGSGSAVNREFRVTQFPRKCKQYSKGE